MERIKSALFIDFDNIFGGLHQLDRQAAYALADEPGKWLAALATQGLPSGIWRELLIRRAYLNPGGSIEDEERGNQNGRLFLQRFRPNLIQSGFEVVDCPALTYQQKNAADIRIVIDILQSSDAATRYDEFIIASSDADFTPLLQCLRANDRQTMIISSGQSAPAYRNLSNTWIDATELVDMLAGNSPAATPETATRSAVQKMAREYIADNDRATLLADLGQEVQKRFGQAIKQSNWFGCGTLAAFIMESFDNLEQSGHYVWIAGKHPPPSDQAFLYGALTYCAHIR